MSAKINERSAFAYYVFSILTLGIYALVFWSKLAKDVNTLCEGDGKKTMKYFPSWLLSIVTLGVFGFVWRCKLANRLKENAERYDLRFSEGGKIVVVLGSLGLVMALLGPAIGHFILIKNFNKLAVAYNEYNGLVDPEEDEEEPEEAEEAEGEEVVA